MKIDQKKAAELFAISDKLIELHQRMSNTIGQLRRAIVHESEKEGEAITVRDYKRIMRAYHRAIEAGEEQFTVDGRELLVAYAKHLLTYLDSRLTHQFTVHDEMDIRNELSRHRRAMQKQGNG